LKKPLKKSKKKIIVEFFHANTHKGVHIGHIRNISIGESLCRILEATGNKVYRVNYFGDIGPHVAKCLWAYLNLKKKEPKDNKGVWLGKLYALANEKAKKSIKVEEQIKEINNKLYAKDKKLVQIWKKTRKYCYDDFDKIYKIFGFKFDRLYPESECEKPGKQVVSQLLKKGIAEKSDGAIIADLKKYDLAVTVLLSSENNVLYHAKDLGLLTLKSKEYKNIDKSLHVVGSEQNLYFKQLFKIFGLMKHKYAKISQHLSYGLVMLPEGKMSSREGTLVFFEDLKNKLLENAEKEIKKRHKLNKKELQERTEKIAYSALKFGMIHREFNKSIVFDWDKALDFEGETGPYIQYTYARIASILRKSKENSSKTDYSLLNSIEEQAIVTKLSQFKPTIENAALTYKPNLISHYLIELSQLFNEFYHKHQVLKAEKEIKHARLALIKSVKEILKQGLNLLGIDTLEKM